jgi:hypothetical protein
MPQRVPGSLYCQRRMPGPLPQPPSINSRSLTNPVTEQSVVTRHTHHHQHRHTTSILLCTYPIRRLNCVRPVRPLTALSCFSIALLLTLPPPAPSIRSLPHLQPWLSQSPAAGSLAPNAWLRDCTNLSPTTAHTELSNCPISSKPCLFTMPRPTRHPLPWTSTWVASATGKICLGLRMPWSILCSWALER